MTTTAHRVEFDSRWRGFGGIHGGMAVAELLGACAAAPTPHRSRSPRTSSDQ